MQRFISCRRPSRTAGFTMVQMLVVLAIVIFSLGLLIPSVHQTRCGGCSNRVKCAANLKQIGNALILYANENHGYFPRTHYVSGAPIVLTNDGFDDANPYLVAPAGSKINNIPQAMFMLIREEGLTSSIFVCPSGSAEADSFAGQHATNRSNFTSTGQPGGDVTINCGYSFVNVYPTSAAIKLGYKELFTAFSSDFAVAADLSPAAIDNPLWAYVRVGAPRNTIIPGNSRNHDQVGQNVLFADGHVDFFQTPLVGTNSDNIYTPQEVANASLNDGSSAAGSDPDPRSPTDSVLLIHTP